MGVALTALLLGGAPAPALAAEGDGYPTEMPGKPDRYEGEETGCTIPDPTGTGGCVTGATAHLLEQVDEDFGDLPVACWSEHAWNPTSDHPLGKGCDYTFGKLGKFPDEATTERGWLLAEYFKKYSKRLHVRYVIWQGQIWVRGDEEWEPYGGGGVYDPASPTGGHFDHVHVSLTD